MTKPIIFTLDGQTVSANQDETLWEVSKRLGIEIPHLCHKPADSYRPDGNCRACMVEIDGERTLAASCVRKATPGMIVKTNSPRAQTSRKMVLEWMPVYNVGCASEHVEKFRLMTL